MTLYITSFRDISRETKHTMSFLLRNNGKSSKLNGGLTLPMTRSVAPPGTSIYNRSGSGPRSIGGGQSQAQIYRPTIQKQLKASVQQPQKSKTQGAISMAEG